MRPLLESIRPLLELLRSGRGRLGAAAAVALLCGLAIGCGEDDPVNPGNGNGDQGYIAGTTFPQGDASRAAEIKVEIYRHSDDEKVSTVFPNDQGRFVSDALVPQSYYLIASLAADGYYPAQMDNITVIGGRTTEVGIIDVPDTSTVRWEHLLPVPLSLLVERRPDISGEMRSAGSGFKLETFFLELGGNRVTPDVTEITEDRLARFSFSPTANLQPGVVTVRAGITNQAGHLNLHVWAFRILDGIQRRVPQDYATIRDAVNASNDGDTVLVAPGTHVVDNVFVNKDLSFISEDGQETTILIGSDSRHLHLSGSERQVVIKGFTFTGGRALGQEPGGAIFCEDLLITMEDCTFTDNESPTFRGGAIALYNSNSRIRRCTFIDNFAPNGGAVVVYDRSSPELSQCIFIRNTAIGSGAAVFVKGASVLVRNCGFLKNSLQSGGGAAIFADFDPGPGLVFSEESLYVQNSCALSSAILEFNGIGSTISSNCDGFWDNHGLLIDGTGGSSQTVNLLLIPAEDDPGFCNLPAEDLHLMTSSPFITGTCERGPYPPGCNR